MSRRPRFIISQALFSLAITVGTGNTQETRHPVEALVVRKGDPIIRASLLASANQSARVESLGKALLAMSRQRVAARIGRNDGDDGHLLGEVREVRFSSDGRIFVLDPKFGVVRTYSLTGQNELTLGRPGRGPGEFLHAKSLHVLDSARVLVSDVSRRLHEFELGTSTTHLRGSRQISFVAESMCSLDREMIVHARTTSVPHLLFVLDDSLRVRKSFGEVYRTTSRAVDAEMLRGQVACAPREGTVLYAPSSVLGELRAFDADGKARWTVVLSDFSPMEMTEITGARRGFSVRVPDAGYHRLHGLNYHQSGFFVAQYAFTTRRDAIARRDFTKLYTLLIRALDGRVSVLGDEVPPIAAFGPRDAVAIARNDPFPTVTILQLGASK